MCVVMGAGDVDRLARALIDADERRSRAARRAQPASSGTIPLARLTTVRTGGPGEFFARAGTAREQLLELLAWAQAAALAVSVVGSGSNLLIADEGVAGLVLKLDGELAAIEVAGHARSSAAAARACRRSRRAAARGGLSGIEFGVNIPGTVGGAVRMNANAYGGELGARARVGRDRHAPTGFERRAPAGARASPTAARTSRPGRSSRAPRCCCAPATRGVGQGDARGDAPAPPRGPAAGHQDVRLDLQEPRGSARGGTQRRAAARRGRLQRARRRRRALRAQARQLHREHGHGEHRRRDRA